MPIIGKFGAESLTNILADTTLDTAIDTIPSMVELAMDGGSVGEVALEGLKRTGINLGANGAFEAVFKVGKGVLGRTGGGGNRGGDTSRISGKTGYQNWKQLLFQLDNLCNEGDYTGECEYGWIWSL